MKNPPGLAATGLPPHLLMVREGRRTKEYARRTK
jgi:hypothetical protein